MDDPRVLSPDDGAFPSGADARQIPLGSISAVRVAEERCFPALTQHLTALPPWLPLVALAPDHLVPGLTTFLQVADHARATQSLVLAHHTPPFPDPEVVFRRINARPPVSPRLLAQWLATRLDQPDMVLLLETALGQPWGARTPDQVYRQLHRRLDVGIKCHPADLKRLARIATLERMYPTVGRLAAAAETTAASLRRIVSPLLRVSLTTYNERPGWEWVLEAACRQGLGAGGWGLGEDSESRGAGLLMANVVSTERHLEDGAPNVS